MSTTSDQEKLRYGLEIFCQSIKATNKGNYTHWIKIARKSLEILHKSPKILDHFTFHLSEITYCLITRLTMPIDRFPELCPLALELLQILIQFNIDPHTRELVMKFLQNPRKYYDGASLSGQAATIPSIELVPSPFIKKTYQNDKIFTENLPTLPDCPLNLNLFDETLEVAKKRCNEYVSLCVLDLAGNFLLCDENSKKIFGRAYKKLKGKNLFRDLMIPFSLAALRKKYKGDVFNPVKNDKLSSVFSYTIYSCENMNKYTKELVTKCQDPLRKNLPGEESVQRKDKVRQFMSSLIEKLADEKSEAIYYKFLQNLTSKASLIDVQLTKADVSSEVFEGKEAPAVKVSAGKILQGISETPSEGKNQITRTVILLETRKAKHIQDFPYHLMTKDPKIEKWIRNYFILFSSCSSHSLVL